MWIDRLGPTSLIIGTRTTVTFLVSYNTPVAILRDGKRLKTSHFFSQTTSKHINSWGPYDGEIDQQEIDELFWRI